MARPVIATLFPHLSSIVQPLSGEYGGRRSLLETLPFVRGYGVEIGMIIDVAEAVGVRGMAQVDLGTRIHRNRDLDDLGPQALVVLQTALDRAGVRCENPATLVRPGRPPLVRTFGELPPLATLPDLLAGPAPEPPPPPRRARRPPLPPAPAPRRHLTGTGCRSFAVLRTLGRMPAAGNASGRPPYADRVTAPPRLTVRGRALDLDRARAHGHRQRHARLVLRQRRAPHHRGPRRPWPSSRWRRGRTVIDVGGQSGITGVPEVPVDEEIARVVPVVAGLHAAAPDVVISVDTYRPAVVEAVLDAGAADRQRHQRPAVPRGGGPGGRAPGPGWSSCTPARGPSTRCSTTRCTPRRAASRPTWSASCAERLDAAEAAGVPEEATILDPGPDFAKTPAQTVEVLRRLDAVPALGRPLLLALSRKDFIGAVTGRPAPRAAGRHPGGGRPRARPRRRRDRTVLRVHDVGRGRPTTWRWRRCWPAARTCRAETRLADHLRRT